MRNWIVPALALALGGCEEAPRRGGAAPAATANGGAGIDAAIAPSPAAFDYRYRYRLPAARIAAVQESHAKGCDRLGSARCRITAMRYAVGEDGKVAAVLTLKLDPALARAYGRAATTTVSAARGMLIDADVAGADTVAATGRSDTVIARLRDAAGNADARLAGLTDPGQRAAVAATADRLRSAIAAIGEIDQGAASSLATTPVILTYASGGPVAGLGGSSEASFAAAGQTFLQSLSGLAIVLAGIGPWIVLLLGGALLLRRIIQPDETPAPQLPPAPREVGNTHGNVIQRWFQRDEPHPENVD